MSLPYLHPYLGLSNGLNTLHAAGGGAGGIGGWVELGRTTLGSNGDTITVSSLADKRYYMVLGHFTDSGLANVKYRMGNSTLDTGGNYAKRQSVNGGADVTGAPQSNVEITQDNADDDKFHISYISNNSSNEKLMFNWAVERGDNSGAANAPARVETVCKWANTSNPLDIISCFNDRTGDYTSGSEVVVLGWDPADTHTNNFWEELDSVTLESAGDTLQSNTFTAKKYLWIQYMLIGSTTDLETQITFNADSGSNYAQRRSQNGGSDVTNINQSKLEPITSKNNYNYFGNMFFINNASNEKLGIHHSVEQNAAGASNAPSRHEGVMKWTNTSNQITSVKIFNNGAADYSIGSTIKVWGAN